jgi:hypothetical protein
MLPKRAALGLPLFYTLLGLVACGTILGLWVVLQGEYSWIQTRTLATILNFAFFCVLAMACNAARRETSRNVLPTFGLLVGSAVTVVWLLLTWVDNSSFSDSTYSLAAAIVGSVWFFAFTHASLLGLAIPPRSLWWLKPLAVQLIMLLALFISVQIIDEFIDVSIVPGERVYPFMVALSILVVAITMALPILHTIRRMSAQGKEIKLSGDELLDVERIDREISALRERIAELQRMRDRYA